MALSPNLTVAPTTGLPLPSYPGRMQVDRSPEEFGNGASSLIDLPAGTLSVKIAAAKPGTKAYTSVQTGRDSHIELHSDLVYCNHSCTPSLNFDMKNMEVRVVDDRPLKIGDALTFFYPSTEWEMGLPIDCACGAGEGICKGKLSGAKAMDRAELEKYWLNDHIRTLKNAPE